MFPMTFNLADFKNSLLSRSSLQFPAGFPSSAPAVPNLSAPVKEEENSVDNSSSSLFQTLNSLTSNPDLIQANVDKILISDALDMVQSLPLDLQSANGSEGNESDSEENGGDDDSLTVAEITADTIQPDTITFGFQGPNLVPSYLNAHYTCETGSRLLFATALWVGRIPVFQLLPADLQTMLLTNAWPELFLLNFTQMVPQLSFSTIMTAMVDYFKQQVSQQEKVVASGTTTEKLIALSEMMALFNDAVHDLVRLQLDEHEYASLRAVLLFSARGARREYPRYVRHLDRAVHVATEALHTQLERRMTAQHRNGSFGDNGGEEDDELRTGSAGTNAVNVVLRVTTGLTKFTAPVVEELFFSNVAGQVQVENVIPYILKLGNSSSNTTVTIIVDYDYGAGPRNI